jgi:hypothetical protein
MIGTLAFVALMMLAEVAVVWLAYCAGHTAGWFEGWEDRFNKS